MTYLSVSYTHLTIVFSLETYMAKIVSSFIQPLLQQIDMDLVESQMVIDVYKRQDLFGIYFFEPACPTQS